jgi:hypothetical protein
MSHLVRDELHRIDLGDGEWVDIKRHTTIGDLEAIEKVAPFTAEKSMVRARATLQVVIKAWSFTEDGKPVPVSEENILCLSSEATAAILTEVNRLNPARTPEEMANLLPPSPSTSGSPGRSPRRTTRR